MKIKKIHQGRYSISYKGLKYIAQSTEDKKEWQLLQIIYSVAMAEENEIWCQTFTTLKELKLAMINEL